jgi:hypothetical protein
MMKQEDAKEAILREWRTLPKSKQDSVADRLIFVTQARQKYVFQCSGDPHQVIMGWLTRESPRDPW